MKKAIIAAIVALTGVSYAGSGYYDVTLTRVDSNIYKVYGTDMYILTKMCYEYVILDKAILVWNAPGKFSSKKLMFLDWDGKPKASCDVEALLVETEPK